MNFSSRQTSSTVTDNLYTSLDSQSIIKQLNILSAAFKSDYNENISSIKKILKGNLKDVRNLLKERMLEREQRMRSGAVTVAAKELTYPSKPSVG